MPLQPLSLLIIIKTIKMKNKKRTSAKERKCGYPKCGIPFTPLSDKAVYHDAKCRMAHDRERRNERDALFLSVIRKLKKNYQLLLLYKDQTIVTFQELCNIDFCFSSCPVFEGDIHGAFSDFGSLLLRDLDNGTYRIEHNEE